MEWQEFEYVGRGVKGVTVGWRERVCVWGGCDSGNESGVARVCGRGLGSGGSLGNGSGVTRMEGRGGAVVESGVDCIHGIANLTGFLHLINLC